MHHTDLVIEEGGQLFVVNYGEITAVPATRPEALRQNSSAGQGLAYRVFGEGSEETDKMLAHIDSPMGMFLREVSTGTASYNPFQMSNYSIAIAGIAKSGGTHVQVFFGELGGAIAYAHKKFQTETKSACLSSQVLYINTGLGLVSPKLDLGNFSFYARTDLTLEGGIWIKQYSDGTNKTKNPAEGDVNIVSNTKVTAEYKKGPVKVVGTAGIEIMPSFATAFPRATDGSSAEGLGSTLGVLPNRVTTTLDVNYQVTPKVNLFLGPPLV